MTLRTIVGVGLAAGLLGVSPRADASVVVPADFAELVRQARVVVCGRVVRVVGVWADGRRRVDTLVTLEAVEYFKGDFGTTVTVRVPGGELGRYRSIVVGAPVFEAGDEVVLLLGARGSSVPYVLGLSQGVFRVVARAGTGEKLVVPPLLVAGADAAVVRRGDPARRPVTLAQFGDAVRRLAGGGPGAVRASGAADTGREAARALRRGGGGS